MNNALTLHLSDALAARLAREAGRTPAARSIGPTASPSAAPPNPTNGRWAVRVVEQFGPATLARAIFNANEFLYVE